MQPNPVDRTNRCLHPLSSPARAGFAFALVALAASSLAALAPPHARAAETRMNDVELRNKMVDEEIVAAGVKNPRVIEAMRTVPRHEFVPRVYRPKAYLDMALPIGEGQTISPPFVVATMTEAIDPQPGDKVLEIGTGSGYQAAVLSGLVREVYSIEIVQPLGRTAAKTLKRLRYDNVEVKVGDGFLGWAEHAPFDKIIVTCSPEKVPPALEQQLAEGGRMVIPVGERYQQTLYSMTKKDGKLVREALLPTLFVPMTGAAEGSRRVQPDPLRPALVNGDFEQTLGEPPQAAGWHYQRQMAIVGEVAPQGKAYALFSNQDAGRGAQALQGFAVDGRKVNAIEVSALVLARDIRAGSEPDQRASINITFYDERRATVGQGTLGPWSGSFSWQPQRKVIDVPPKAREAIIGIGLFGATGALGLDNMELKPVKK